MDDDLLERYRIEAAAAMEQESMKRIAETSDPEKDAALRQTSLHEVEDMVAAIFARLGPVRAALDGHGGGISIEDKTINGNQFNFVLDLTGACLSCGAAPGTLQGIKADLEKDDEIESVKFSAKLLDTFDELGREFILAHGNVEFV
jgi:Fe-S cluster biogenesis protein NfuA